MSGLGDGIMKIFRKGKLRASWVEFSIQLSGAKGRSEVFFWRPIFLRRVSKKMSNYGAHTQTDTEKKPGQSQSESFSAKAEPPGQGYGSCGPMKLQSVLSVVSSSPFRSPWSFFSHSRVRHKKRETNCAVEGKWGNVNLQPGEQNPWRLRKRHTLLTG